MILLTGATGFIGNQVLEGLIKKLGSEHVVVLTSKPTAKCKFVIHNDYRFAKEFFANAGLLNIKTIIHAGAFTPKSAQESNDIDQSNSNIWNTTTLLAAVLPNLKKIIFLSTIDVYGFDDPITEKSPVNPVSLYGFSKLYCEKLISIWAEKKNVQCQILRIGHVYGPGEEKYQKLIPMVMKQILNNDPVKLIGAGTELRTFIYISDVVQSVLKSIELQSKNDTINVVGEEPISIKNLIDEIIKISGKNAIIHSIASEHEPRNLIFDNTKLKNQLHTPTVSLVEGLINEWEYLKQL